jgi:hypothetical protein
MAGLPIRSGVVHALFHFRLRQLSRAVSRNPAAAP